MINDPKTPDPDNSGDTTDDEDFHREIGIGEDGDHNGPPDDE